MPAHKRRARKKRAHTRVHHARRARSHRKVHARGSHRSKLTKRQLMQRKYAGKLRSLRAKLQKKGRGVGRILKSASAQKLRRKYGVHNPYAKR